MRRIVALALVLACLGVAAGCGTSNGPGAAANAEQGTQGQDAQSQPSSGGMKNGAFTAANNVCSMYPLTQLAQQNGLPSNATKKQVARKVSLSETLASNRKLAYAGCLHALNTP